MKDKRGVSPVITTVLLVLIALVLAAMIIMWGYAFIGESLTKFEGQDISLACDAVSITADYDSAEKEIAVVNTGDIPIFKVGVKSESDAETTYSEYPPVKLNSGGSRTLIVDIPTGAKKLNIVPIILGKTSSDKIQEYPCPEASWRTIVL